MKRTVKRILSLGLSALLFAGALTSCVTMLPEEKLDGQLLDKGEEVKLDGHDLVGYAAANMEYPTCDPSGEDALPMSDAFVRAAADFGWEMLKRQEKGENTMISPVSLLYALGMTANGASGETLSQMEDVLYGGISADEANRYFLAFSQNLPDGDGGALLDIANSIWINTRNEHFVVREPFMETNRAYYGAGVFGRDFLDPATVPEVNKWVSDNTDGMIPSVISELNEEDLMLLINTVLFDGKWAQTYGEYDIREMVFTNYDGSTSPAQMLCSEEWRHFSFGDGVGFVRPYAEKYSFVGILPEEGVDVYDYVQSFTGTNLVDAVTEAMKTPTGREALVRIPEFTFDYSTSAVESLAALGMTDAFTTAADFSRMGEAENGICIGDVIHKTRIELTRNGTKAAAVTAVVATATGAPVDYVPPVEIYLTRPFVFAIVDNETGLPIFSGIVTEIG